LDQGGQTNSGRVHFGSGILKSQLQNQKPAPKEKKAKEEGKEKENGCIENKMD